jgi:hypothetical protein
MKAVVGEDFVEDVDTVVAGEGVEGHVFVGDAEEAGEDCALARAEKVLVEWGTVGKDAV